MTNDFKKCDDIRAQLFELNSTDSLTDGMKKHLDQCEDCTSVYQDILAINQGIESLPEHDVSDAVFNKTLAAIKADKTISKSINKGINPQWATGMAASFVLVAVAGLIYNGSISEFQVDFSQVPSASEPEAKPQQDKRLNRQVAAEKAETIQAESATSVDVVYFEDLDIETKTRARRIPAKSAPAIKNTLDKMRADQPLNAPAAVGNGFGDNQFDAAKVVADRIMDADDEQDNLSELDRITVTGSRINSSDLTLAKKENTSNERSLDQMLQVDEQSSPEENKQREEQFISQGNKLSKDKTKRDEYLAEETAELVVAEAKEAGSASLRADQFRTQTKNDGLLGQIEENESLEFIDSSGGMVDANSAKQFTNDLSLRYLSELQKTENLSFKSATGYWANTYLPGDPNMRWIQAQLKQHNSLNLPVVSQNVQPFDYPTNAALGLYLNSDHKTLNEAGPTRIRLQVGIQAGQQKGGHRSALNLAVVLDLGQPQKTDLKAESKALLSALLKAKQPADQISVYLVGAGQILSAEDFRHGPIQVAMDKIFDQNSVTEAVVDLQQTLTATNAWLKSQDDPNAVLGSSAVLLVSANSEFTSSSKIESMVQKNAIDGITLSTVSLAGMEHRTQLERLALMGQGHSRVLAGVEDAQRLINEELLVSSRAVARALRLQIKLAEGVQLIDVLDSYSLNELQAQKVRDAEQSLDQRMSKNLGITADRGKDDDGIQIVIPSYFAGDTHVILLDVLVNNPGPVAEVSAKYKDLIYLRNATSQKNLHLNSGQNDLGPLELNVMKNVLAHHLSQTVNQASQAIRMGDHQMAVVKLKTILELYQAMRHHIPAWKADAEMIQDESIIQQYLQLLNSQSSINPKQYQLIADAMSFISWRKLISHSP